MSSEDPESALALAEEVLERALRIGATEAEVLVMAGDSALTRFANSEIHQNVAERSLTVNLRYVVGQADRRRLDGQGRPRRPAHARPPGGRDRAELRGARRLGGSARRRRCARGDDRRRRPAPAWSSAHAPRRHAGVPRRGRARGHRRRRRRGRHRVRLVLDRRRGRRGRQLGRASAQRRAGPRRSCSPSTCRPTAAPATPRP